MICHKVFTSKINVFGSISVDFILPKVLPGMVTIFLESLLVLRKSDTFTTMLWGLYFR